MKRFLPLLLCASLMLAGCSLLSTFWSADGDETAQTLAWDGMEKFESGKYEKAKEAFEKLKDWYPYSKYAILAELKIADAHYRLQEYEEAIFAYEEFESLHPRNEAISYVIYQVGRCYFEQIDAPDRDQVSTRKALDTFGRLIRDYPDDTYAVKAREHINTCLRSLAESEFRIGLYYYNSKRYRAALGRFQNILIKYPDVGVHQRALQYLALTEEALIKATP
jgi:outer membrane protein assembly factor BamD